MTVEMKNGDKILYYPTHSCGTYDCAIDDENCLCLFPQWSDLPIHCKISDVKLREFMLFEELNVGDIFLMYGEPPMMKIEPTKSYKGFQMSGEVNCICMSYDFQRKTGPRYNIQPKINVERYYKRGTV